MVSKLPRSLPWQCAKWFAYQDKRDAATADFLARTFSHYFPNATSKERMAWAMRHIQLLSIERMDAYAMQRIGKGNGVSLFLEGDELLAQASRMSTGVLLIFNHYDRILTGAIALAQKGFKLNSLRIELDENAPIDDDIKYFLNAKTKKFEAIVGGISLGRRDSMRRLYKGLKQGEIWCIVADAWDEAATEKKAYPFLGSHIYLSNGLERIALHTGAALIHVASYSESANRVRVRLTPLQHPKTAMRDTLAILQADVAQNPWAWWNWGVMDALTRQPTFPQ